MRILCAYAVAYLFLAAPHLAAAQTGAAAEPIPMEQGAEQRTLRFSRFRTALRPGDRIGEIRTGSPCSGPMLLTMNARTEQAMMAPVTRVVREEFVHAGYRDPIRRQQKLFEDDSDLAPSELLLGGMLEEFQTTYCSSASGAHTDGNVRIKVRWELYDTIDRKVTQTKVTIGSYKTSGEQEIREGEFFAMAYRDAVRQLLADAEFHSLALLKSTASAAKAGPSAESDFRLALRAVAPIKDAMAGNLTLTRAAVVTIKQPGGTGSGFFISQDGHVVTNSHVVGSSRFVRVVLATGRELVGEVIQRSSERDVALIKTEGSNFVALALGLDDVNVGSEVTAIGSPLGEELSGTVTRGIVSAYRTIKGKRYIQSDVPVLPGSSGGPLLDKSGRVVGITVAGIGTTRINFFIPIQEALGSLGVSIARK